MSSGMWLAISLMALPAQSTAVEPEKKPLPLGQGVHLLLDDHFIARRENVARQVAQPQRFLAEPLVTGNLEHQNWQPFLTVLHDPAAAKNPFRMWYNVDAVDDPADGAFFGITGYLESADGVRWKGPHQRLNSLAVDGRVRFGASVLDDGAAHKPPGERYKILYFDAGKEAGPRVAFSPDGLNWTLHQGGKPVIPTANGDDIWSAAYDPLRKRYFLFGKTFGPYTWTTAEKKTVTANIRRYYTSYSSDFKTWSKHEMVFSPDQRDAGITQWYGPAGFMVRGDLMVAFLRVLRDDLSPEGAPPEAIAANTKGSAGLGASGLGGAGGSGMGYTVLTWTRDGRTWERDRHTDKFFEPDPQTGAWDHAMAWIGSSVAVKDEVNLYYAGYRWGHKYRHSVDRQLGLVKMQRDRFVAQRAGEKEGIIFTPPLVLDGEGLALNVDALKGEARVQVTDDQGKAIPGFGLADCAPITHDSLDAPVHWKQPLSLLRGRTVHLEVRLRNASLYAFSVK